MTDLIGAFMALSGVVMATLSVCNGDDVGAHRILQTCLGAAIFILLWGRG